MKKLILMLLVLVGGVMQANADADELTTVYLKPSSDWKSENARFALYMFDSSETNTAEWFSFIKITDDLYYALFNKTKFDKMILCRMDGSNTDNNWSNKKNQSDDLVAPSTSSPVYSISGWSTTPTTSSIENSGCTIHKIYVQDKEGTGQAPHFYEYQNSTWYAIDNAWPGSELSTEVVGDKTWYVFKTLKTTVLGRFMQAWNNNSNFAAGGIEFDLSDGNLFYNYYPSAYQSILTSEALSTPAILHFRSNNGAKTLKHYFWNNTGINDAGFTTTSAGGATDWVTITTYKPSLSIQFYTYDNGGDDTDKSDGIDITGLTGGENYYYFAKLNANNATGDYEHDGKGIMKMQDSYYLVYADGWDFDSSKETYSGSGIYQTVGAVELTPNLQNGFLFEGTLDNTDGKKTYFAIVPASDWSGTAITTWSNLISPSHPASTDSKHTISKFEVDECAAMPTTWTRWNISGVNEKFDMSFNFATMTLESTPFITREITANSNLYATFSSDYDVAVPEHVTAYYALQSDATLGSIKMTKFTTGINASDAAFLVADAAGTYKFTPAEDEPTVISGNMLKKGSNDELAASTDGAYHYVFAKQNGVVAFYNVASNYAYNLKGKAYVESTTNLKPQNAPVYISFDDQSTGIDAMLNDNREMINNNVIFDLQGRRVENPTKGLYIVNGKKVFIK